MFLLRQGLLYPHAMINQTDQKDLTEIAASEVQPISFHSKFLKPGDKPYEVSRGRSKMVRTGIVYIVLALLVSLISLKLLPTEFGPSKQWIAFLAWIPRAISLALVLMAFLKFRDLKNIDYFLKFDTKGIYYNNKEYQWGQIDKITVTYSSFDDSVYQLNLYVGSEIEHIDLLHIDEFSEDAVCNLNKYYSRYQEDLKN